MRLGTLAITIAAFVGACVSSNVGTQPSTCPADWEWSRSADSSVSACIPPRFARARGPQYGTGARWERGSYRSPDHASLSVHIDTAFSAVEEWPPRLRATSPCTADCISVDSVVAHEDTVAGTPAHVETGLASGGFAGLRRQPTLVAGWLQGRHRIVVNGMATQGAALDTLRQVVRTIRLRGSQTSR
jgi:hypothetical protein